MSTKALTCCLVTGALTLAGCSGPAGDKQAGNPRLAGTGATKPTATPKPRPTPEAELRAVELAEDGKLVAIGTLVRTEPLTGTVTLRDGRDNRQWKQWTVPGGVVDLSLSRDKKLLAVASPNAIALYQLPAGRLLRRQTLNNHGLQYPITCDFSPDGRTLAVSDGEINLLDVKTGRRKRAPGAEYEGPGFVFSVNFSPDGRYLATSHSDIGIAVEVWSLRTGKGRELLGGDAGPRPVFSRDGRLLAGQSERETAVFNIRTARLVRVMEKVDEEKNEYGSTFAPYAFSPDGRQLAGRDSSSGRIEIWDVRRGRLLRTLPQKKIVIAWPERRTLVVHDDEGKIERIRF